MTVTTQPYTDDFYDVPAQQPAVGIALDRVGVHGQRARINAADDLFGGPFDLLCDVNAEVSLGSDQRGIHMSRIERAIAGAPTGLSLPAAALAIAREVRDGQAQDSARVTLAATVPLSTRTPVTGQLSPDTADVSALAVAGPNPYVELALSATNITACPCMQGYALTELVTELGLSPDDGRALLGRIPIATHSQKGKVRLAVRAPAPEQLPDYALLYRTLSEATALTQELLKRPDEYELVRRSHLRPQFVEDVVRTTTLTLARALSNSPADDIELNISAESHESIHGHNIHATLHLPLSTALTHLSPSS
ncbi:GTP cyclohydrolase, FolE2/MptA family [Nonomuraea sediminis]|uniref:GTP cyclohydrolase, FolE2/MptA family n=1 Tax=Nonomuraea sediminis TaxID=2835864 RepID=UPI001BDC0243|nr:GTP cyclohydrolase, FolE2/MptA family [Nonomuraea sediminis]